MFLNLGPLEIMVLLVIALIVFGPARLPELMASAGQAIREFQRASRELTEVFQETQQEFSSALDLESAATTVTEPAAEPSANGHATTEVAETVPIVPDVPVTTAPAEYETAAAMIDPVEPYPTSPRPVEPPPSAPADTVASEFGTAAGLIDDAPPPFAVASEPPPTAEGAPAEGAFESEPLATPRVRRPRRPKEAAADEGSAIDPVAPADSDAETPLLETSVATAAAEPLAGATAARRRTPRTRPRSESAVAPPDEPA
jgi:TatA/E family protein of Tat protein translocase